MSAAGTGPVVPAHHAPGRRVGRVLLVRAPLLWHEAIGHEDPHPPLELLQLAAVLRSQRDVAILDGMRDSHTDEPFGALRRMGLGDAQLAAEAVAFGPDLIGLSVTWHNQLPSALHTARLLRRHLPDATIVAGGIAASSSPEALLASPDVDFVVAGYGEGAIVALCAALEGRRGIDRVPGLWYRDGGRLRSNPKADLAELDEVPFPAWDLVRLGDYDAGFRHGHHKAAPLAGVLPTRGCPHNCSFCSLPAVSERRFRAHSVERVVRDLVRLRDVHGVREVHFYDDNLIHRKRFAKLLFKRLIEERVGLPWLAEAGFAVWEIDQELLDLAVASGMHRLDLPIETGSARVRAELMNKDLYDNSRVAEVVRMARRAGVERVFGFVIVGSPGETVPDIAATLDLFARMDLDFRGVRVAQPFPGTEFYRVCVENGWLAPDFSYDRLWFTAANLHTPEFRPADVTALVAAGRAAALLRTGHARLPEVVRDIERRHGAAVAREAEAHIVGFQQRYHAAG